MLVACWAVGVAGSHAAFLQNLWLGVSFTSAAFIPAAFLAFISAYESQPRRSPGISIAYLIAFAFAALCLGSRLVVYDATIVVGAGAARKTGPLYPLFAVYVLFAWAYAVGIFIRNFRTAKGRTRAELQYLGIGLVVPVAGAIVTNLIIPLISGRSNFSWVGPCLGLAFIGIVGHAVIRHRLLDLRLVVHRGLTITLATLLSLLPVAALLAVFWPRLLQNLDGSELTALLLAVGVVAVLVPVTRDVASRLLDRYVYRTQANYRRTVREASRILTRVLELRQLLSFLSGTLRQSTGVEGVAVYLDAEGSFQRAIVDNGNETAPFAAPEQAPGAVTAALQATREPVLADDVIRDRSSDAALVEAVTSLNWSLILPVESENDVIAIIAVGPKLSGDSFYPQDLDLLMTLANQAGIAIKNARLYAAVVLMNEYLQNIVGTIESGVVAITATGHVTMFNRAAEQLTGLDAQAYRGHPASVLPPCLREPLSATVADGRARTIPEAELPTGDVATTRPIICTTSPLRDPEGHVLGAVVVFSDLTPLKELEIERRRAERLAYFQALASGIAHEIKNPLVAIKTFTQLLPRRRTDERFLAEFGRIGNREIGRMHRLLERLRTLSRPGGGPRSVVDLRSSLLEALESLQAAVEQKGHVLTVSIGEAPANVIGNSTELQQLFMNLLLNAHEATPAGGDITVELVCTSLAITVEIRDSGPGIQPELLERIFEPFFTTKQRGSGLGLAISAGIAQSHGGRIQADNRSVGGAIFTVTLPRTEQAMSVVS